MKIKVSYEKDESALWANIKLQSDEHDPKEENIIDGLDLAFVVKDPKELSISRHFASIAEAHHWVQQAVNQIANLVRTLREPVPLGWEMEV